MAFVLLSGAHPFDPDGGGDEDAVTAAAAAGRLRFESTAWARVSASARDFIARCLVVDPMRRWTAAKALSHPWLSRLGATEQGAPLPLGPALSHYQQRMGRGRVGVHATTASVSLLHAIGARPASSGSAKLQAPSTSPPASPGPSHIAWAARDSGDSDVDGDGEPSALSHMPLTSAAQSGRRADQAASGSEFGDSTVVSGDQVYAGRLSHAQRHGTIMADSLTARTEKPGASAGAGAKVWRGARMVSFASTDMHASADDLPAGLPTPPAPSKAPVLFGQPDGAWARGGKPMSSITLPPLKRKDGAVPTLPPISQPSRPAELTIAGATAAARGEGEGTDDCAGIGGPGSSMMVGARSAVWQLAGDGEDTTGDGVATADGT